MFSKKIKNKNKINKNNNNNNNDNNSLTYSLAKGMTVPELRNELKLRGLSTSGKKATLIHRVKYYATRHPDLLDLKNKKRNYNNIKDSNNDDEINETPQKKRKIDNNNNNNKNNSNNNDDDYKESEPEVPDDFLCPITYDIMKEPYISFHSGRSFEKKAIMNHVILNGNDPITRQAITPKDLIPNRNLKSLIQKWVEQNNYKMDDSDDDDDDDDDSDNDDDNQQDTSNGSSNNTNNNNNGNNININTINITEESGTIIVNNSTHDDIEFVNVYHYNTGNSNNNGNNISNRSSNDGNHTNNGNNNFNGYPTYNGRYMNNNTIIVMNDNNDVNYTGNTQNNNNTSTVTSNFVSNPHGTNQIWGWECEFCTSFNSDNNSMNCKSCGFTGSNGNINLQQSGNLFTTINNNITINNANNNNNMVNTHNNNTNNIPRIPLILQPQNTQLQSLNQSNSNTSINASVNTSMNTPRNTPINAPINAPITPMTPINNTLTINPANYPINQIILRQPVNSYHLQL